MCDYELKTTPECLVSFVKQLAGLIEKTFRLRPYPKKTSFKKHLRSQVPAWNPHISNT